MADQRKFFLSDHWRLCCRACCSRVREKLDGDRLGDREIRTGTDKSRDPTDDRVCRATKALDPGRRVDQDHSADQESVSRLNSSRSPSRPIPSRPSRNSFVSGTPPNLRNPKIDGPLFVARSYRRIAWHHSVQVRGDGAATSCAGAGSRDLFGYGMVNLVITLVGLGIVLDFGTWRTRRDAKHRTLPVA